MVASPRGWVDVGYRVSWSPSGTSGRRTSAVDRPGPTSFGVLVEDLDATHHKALAVGATEVAKPHDAQGMPRNSAAKDASGNWISLYQG